MMKVGTLTLMAQIFAVVATLCLIVGIVGEVMEEDLGLYVSSWYSISIAVYLLAAWFAIMRLRTKKSTPSE